jgi:hypothetical protein
VDKLNDMIQDLKYKTYQLAELEGQFKELDSKAINISAEIMKEKELQKFKLKESKNPIYLQQVLEEQLSILNKLSLEKEDKKNLY